MARAALQAECRELKKWLPPGFKLTATNEALRIAIQTAKASRSAAIPTTSVPVRSIDQVSLSLSLSLPNDLLEAIATYTPPFSTMNIVTLDGNTATRFGYSPVAVLWKKKLRVERKGLIFDDSLIGPGGWYLYYRVINTRLEGGRAYLMQKSGPDTLLDSGVVGCSAPPLGNTIRTLTLTRARESENRARKETVEVCDQLPNRTIEDLSGLTRDGCRMAGATHFSFSEPAIWFDSTGTYILDRSGCMHCTLGVLGPVVFSLDIPLGASLTVGPSGNTYDLSTLPADSELTQTVIIHSTPQSANMDNNLHLRVYHTGHADVVAQRQFDPGRSVAYQFPEVPRVLRAVWRSRAREVLLLSPDGRIHHYDFRLEPSYRGVLDLPLCCDLQQIRNHPVYVTVD